MASRWPANDRNRNIVAVKLANIEFAMIPVEKVRDYLPSPNHSIGRYKAAFFRSLGYDQADWETLADDL